MPLMHARYASSTYNPHSLSRRWGLFFSDRILSPLPSGENPNRQTQAFRSQLAQSIQTDFQHSFVAPPAIAPTSGKIATSKAENPACQPETAPILLRDEISNLDSLTNEVGIDVLALAVLADVPLHRPRNLELKDLVAQWRWLRLVWSHLCQPENAPMSNNTKDNVLDVITTVQSESVVAVTRQIDQYRYNIALAELRKLFQFLRKSPANRQNPLQLCFIELLRLFCPYIGHELLYRYGAIKSPDQTES